MTPISQAVFRNGSRRAEEGYMHRTAQVWLEHTGQGERYLSLLLSVQWAH